MKYAKQKSACSDQIVLRLPPALRDKIEHAAAAEGRSLANLTRRVLEQWAAEHDGRSEAA
jgi:predicted HicB family RNase H-like nuclease